MFKRIIWFVLLVFLMFNFTIPVYTYAETSWFFIQSNLSPHISGLNNSTDWKLQINDDKRQLLRAIKNFSDYILWLAAFIVMIKGLRNMDFGYIVKYTLIIWLIWLTESAVFYTIELMEK